MDPAGGVQPTLRIEPATYPPTGQQRSPFVLGQLLQGVISARTGAQLFTLELGGQQVQAESAAQLQVGQKLELKVTSLTPQIELQIIPKDPINRMIGNAMHLAAQQAATLPDLATLAQESRQLPEMSAVSQETLQLFASSTAVRPATEPLQSQPQWTAQLLRHAVNALPALTTGEHSAPYAGLSDLLQQLSGSPFLAQPLAAEASTLAALFSASAGLPSGKAAFATPSGEIAATPALTRLNSLVGNEPQLLTLLNQLGPLLERAQLPADHPLNQLVNFLARLDLAPQPLPDRQLSGPRLETLINRLGIDMERLLAAEKPQETVRTLKYALLELSQHLEGAGKSPALPEQLVKTIELYQLLQIRLAGESLFFLPLPLSFLEQGYLLADMDRSDSGTAGPSEQTEKGRKYELHLQLAGLGNLRITLQQREDRVALQFFAEDAERARYLSDFRHQLDQWLTALDLESVQFLIGAKQPAASLLEKIMHGTTGMVDTTA